MKALFFLSFLFIFACKSSDDDGVICTLEARAGLNVTVRDAQSNNYLGQGITVVATDGAYSETLAYMDGIIPSFAGAWERKGTYVLTVSSPGYITFVSDAITVTADECHVIPQQVEINLQPE